MNELEGEDGYFSDEYLPEWDLNGIFYFMCGLCGSGKTTWASQLAESNDIPIVCPDIYREVITGEVNNFTKEKYVWREVEESLSDTLLGGYSCIYDGTNYSIKNRKLIRQLWGKYPKIKTVGIFVKTSIDKCKDRNSKRDRTVPEEYIDKQFDKLVPPTLNEADVICTVHGENFDDKNFLTQIKTANKSTVQEFTYKQFHKHIITL